MRNVKHRCTLRFPLAHSGTVHNGLRTMEFFFQDPEVSARTFLFGDV